MATLLSDNVISFAGQREALTKRRDVKPESLGIMNDCRDMALKRICALLASTFDKIEDELFELAGKSPDRESQNMYLDARNQSREKRSEIEGAFRKQFVSFFEKKVSRNERDADAPKVGNRFDASMLSLVEDDTLSENIAVNDIAKRLTDKCDEELRALSQRMGFLMSEPDLADEANPIAPDTVIRALKAACDQMTAGFQTKLTVLRLVEQHMAQEMLGMYKDINTHLVAQHILPSIRPTYRKAQTNITRKSGAAGTANATNADQMPGAADYGQAGSDMAHGGHSGVPVNAAADIFATLQQLIAGGAQFDAAASFGGNQYTSVTTGSFAPAPQYDVNSIAGLAAQQSGTHPHAASQTSSFSSQALISALSQIQQRFVVSPVDVRSTDTASASEVSGVAAAIQAIQNFVPGQTPVAELNVLREIKSQGLVQGSNQLDAMTIDIVAMLFDYVFDDKAIPDSIKALIARLQIPVLKVAIIDKAFFSKKNHPVRRLLDSLADASVAFAGEASHEDPLYQKIECIVDRVHNEFETDVTLFETLQTDFAEFLRARETSNAEIIEQSARAMHEREKREMARLIAQTETERRANLADIPAPVAAMLRGPWTRVLERLYLRDGGRNQRFAEALETVDQLIWSVQPKTDAAQRKDLVAALPLLLRRLQEGLEIATVETEDRGRFFSALVDCHAVAVKAGLRGESVSILFATLHANAEAAPLFEKLIAEERAREATSREINRSGIARIQFSDSGVEIEEIVPQKSGTESSSVEAMNADHKPAAADKANESSAEKTKAQANFDFDVTDKPVQELKRGTWVEFIHGEGQKIRAKLSWISPLKGVYLFTNPGATEALSISPDALQRQLRKGLARVLEESSLMDRAVDRMVNSLANAMT